MTVRPSPVDVIADSVLDNVDRICDLSPRPLKWSNFDANVRHFIAAQSVAALEAAGYRIVEAPTDWPLDAPHSRACGMIRHPHGPNCHANCPTCSGLVFPGLPPDLPAAASGAPDASRMADDATKRTEGPALNPLDLPLGVDEDEVRAFIWATRGPANWPPPAPGSHESELDCMAGPPITVDGEHIKYGPRAGLLWLRGGWAEAEAARAWSRANTPKENP